MSARQKSTDATDAAFRESLGLRIAEIAARMPSKRSAAEAAGVSAEQLNKWIAGSVKVPVDGLMRLSREAGVDFSWASAGITSHGPPVAAGEMVSLPRFDIQASAGPGTVPASETAEVVIAFHRQFLRERGAVPDRCSVIETRGDSMQPTIPDGSLLIVDHSQTDVGNGAIYVIGVSDTVLVKRVRLRFDGGVELTSDNTAYATEIINRDQLADLRVIGKVVYYCRVP